MKLQVAIDLVDTSGLITLAKELSEVVDIIEVGTPIVMLEGMNAVRELRSILPNSTILADTKIVDGAKLETQYAIEAGADIITVLAVSNDQTIVDCIETAHASGCKVLVDLISVIDVETRAKEIDAMGADYISVHTASDVQSDTNNPLKELSVISKVVKNAKIACAGGIDMNTIDEITSFNPEVIIIGSGITNSSNPYITASKFSSLIKER